MTIYVPRVFGGTLLLGTSAPSPPSTNAVIYVPRAFGGTLILKSAAPLPSVPSTITVRWVTRDAYVTWKTRG